jgi:hypothetical protein
MPKLKADVVLNIMNPTSCFYPRCQVVYKDHPSGRSGGIER